VEASDGRQPRSCSVGALFESFFPLSIVRWGKHSDFRRLPLLTFQSIGYRVEFSRMLFEPMPVVQNRPCEAAAYCGARSKRPRRLVHVSSEVQISLDPTISEPCGRRLANRAGDSEEPGDKRLRLAGPGPP
jgi:hypothetical protein